MHTEYYCGEWRESRLGVLNPAGGCSSHRLKLHLPTPTVRYWNPRVDVRKFRVLISTPIRSNMCFTTVFISRPSRFWLTTDIFARLQRKLKKKWTLTTTMLIRASKSMPASAQLLLVEPPTMSHRFWTSCPTNMRILALQYGVGRGDIIFN